jgi:hypothetical protein
MNTRVENENNVWYREFYVWLVIVLPLCAVVASFATLYIAIQNPPEMVVEDYARIEAIAEENIARDRLAAQLGLTASLQMNIADSNGMTPLVLSLDGQPIDALPLSVRVRVFHSTTSKFDAEAILTKTGGRYFGAIKLPDSNYDLRIENLERTWLLSTRPESGAMRVEMAPLTKDTAG